MTHPFLLPVATLVLSIAAVGYESAQAARTDDDSQGATTSEPQAPAPAPRETRTIPERAGEAVSDWTITAQVKAALAADPQLSALRIDVDTDKGVVRLQGPAPSEQAKERAAEVAAATTGVTRVENRLEVRGTSTR